MFLDYDSMKCFLFILFCGFQNSKRLYLNENTFIFECLFTLYSLLCWILS
jgi:hypothetical protein